MANLAIKGHATRGKEVIKILKMLGGKNDNHCCGGFINRIYFINEYGYIESCDSMHHLDYCQYTLEEFLEKFPYKVGDKVQHNGATSCGTVYVIECMNWANNHIEYEISRLHDYNHAGLVTVCAEDLQPFKEQAMIEKLEQITLDIPDGYEFFGINDDNKVVLTKKQPQYPKTYEECCIIIGFNSNALKWNNPFRINKDTHPYIKHFDNLIDSFYKLLICRDAYWMIAGKQMGLDKPWEPDWLDTDTQKYCIYYVGNEIEKTPMVEVHHFLALPTKEIRDMFYENFKNLIEECKELL